MKKLCFFDDVQVQAGRPDWVELSKFVSVAKNANAQLVIVMHKAYSGQEERNIRDACGYYVISNLSVGEFNNLIDLKGTDNALWKAYSRPVDKYSRVAIYDKDERKLYNRDYGDMIPLLPQQQPHPGLSSAQNPSFNNTESVNSKKIKLDN